MNDAPYCHRCGVYVAVSQVAAHLVWHDQLEEWQTAVNHQLNELFGRLQQLEDA